MQFSFSANTLRQINLFSIQFPKNNLYGIVSIDKNFCDILAKLGQLKNNSIIEI